MIEDKDIKAEFSPFSIRPNEIKVYDGKDNYVSVNQVVTKFDKGHLGDLHFGILEIVNEFEFMTSRQIYQMMLYKGLEIKSQDKLNDKLEQMVKNKMLTRYYFLSSEGKSTFKVYALDKVGRYLLKSREIDTSWEPTDNTKPVYMLKSRLAGNQIVISYLNKVPVCSGYRIKPAISTKSTDKKIKASGSVTLNKGSKGLEFLFEVVRREEKWEERLVQKLKIYENFYKFFDPGDAGFGNPPQLVIVAEDTKHIKEIFACIKKENIDLKEQEIFYTEDLLQLMDTLKKSLKIFVLNKEKKTYSVETISIKGLA